MKRAEWQRSLDLIHALDKYWRSPDGIEFADRLVTWRKQTGSTMFPERVLVQTGAPDGKAFAGDLIEILHRVDPYYVSPEVSRLIDAAQADMPDQALLAADLPSEFGFATFSEPIPLKDAAGDLVPIKAIQWAPSKIRREGEASGKPSGFGLMICFYTEPDWNAEAFQGHGRSGNRPPLILVHWTSWVFGETIAEAIFKPSQEEAYGHAADSARLLRRWCAAFWHFCRQPIVVATKDTAERHVRKRMERDDWRIVPDITVITLRHVRQKPEGDPEPAHYDHRFLVRGHWRNQWVPSLGAHRLTWIAPFIKGPDDAPFVPKKRVYRVAR